MRVLGYRNYRFFITGQALSNIGNMMHEVAVGWLAYELTDSTTLLGVVIFSKQLAVFLTGLFSGVVADHFDKKRLVQYSHASIGLLTLLLALLAWKELTTIGILIALQLILGALKGLEMPSRQAFINDVVPTSKLTNAIAFNSTVFNTARVIGPAIAGAIIPLVGEAACFLVYGIMSFGTTFVFQLIREKPRAVSGEKLVFWREFSEGARYTFKIAPIKASLLFVAAFSFFCVSYMVLLPPLAGEVLLGGPLVYGYLNSARGLGAILGGLYMASRKSAAGIPRLITIALALVAIGLFIASTSETLALTFTAVTVIGFGRLWFFSGTNTMLQTIAASDKRGRVLSFYITTFNGSITLGGVAMGALADALGILTTLLLQSIACLVIFGVFASRLKVFAVQRLIRQQ